MVLVFKFWLMITLMTASERRRTTTTPIDNSQWARNVNTSTKTIKGTKKEKICHSANINRKIYWENFIAMLLFLAIEMFLFSFEFPTLLKSLIWNSKKSGKFKMILHTFYILHFFHILEPYEGKHGIILIKKWFNMSCDVLHTLEMKPKIMTQLDSFPDNTHLMSCWAFINFCERSSSNNTLAQKYVSTWFSPILPSLSN